MEQYMLKKNNNIEKAKTIVNRQDMDSEQSTTLLLSEESTHFREFYTSK
jgi:hypothetical protein